MGEVHGFTKEKLIVGVIFHDEKLLDMAMEELVMEFGEWDLVSEEFSFSGEFSTYYDSELGGEGRRRIYSFRRLVEPDRQAEIKEFTNALEAKFLGDGGRRVNIDPGFLSHGRLMLATTKDASFRIPLARGIYTELTLFYARGGWQALPWTYMDYRSERVQSFLSKVRSIYLRDRKLELGLSPTKRKRAKRSEV